jgi:hypothetical protein
MKFSKTMLNFFRITSKVEGLDKAFAQLKLEMDEVKRKMTNYADDFEKLEIKALESRKIYGKKLKQFIQKEEEKAEDDTIEGVFLRDR